MIGALALFTHEDVWRNLSNRLLQIQPHIRLARFP
jgi:hypothetical protein